MTNNDWGRDYPPPNFGRDLGGTNFGRNLGGVNFGRNFLLPNFANPASILYLQRARFASAIVADDGLPLTEVDASNVINASGEQGVVSGTPAATSNLYGGPFARQVGRAWFWKVPARTTIVSGNVRWGFGSNALDSALDSGLDYASTTAVRVKTGTTAITTVDLGAGLHEFALIQRSAGAFLFARAGGSGNYTLLWVYQSITAAEYAKLHLVAGSPLSLTFDDWRVLDLAQLDARFATDTALATSHNAPPAASQTQFLNAHTPDAVLDVQFTFDGTTQSFAYRMQNVTTDKFTIRINAAGTMNLRSVVAGVTTTLVTVALPTAGGTVFQNNVSYRLVGVIVGNVHTWYVDDVSKIAYTDAANSFPTATGIHTAVNPIITRWTNWPRVASLPSASV